MESHQWTVSTFLVRENTLAGGQALHGVAQGKLLEEIGFKQGVRGRGRRGQHCRCPCSGSACLGVDVTGSWAGLVPGYGVPLV